MKQVTRDETVTLTKHGKPVAGMVSAGDLNLMVNKMQVEAGGW